MAEYIDREALLKSNRIIRHLEALVEMDKYSRLNFPHECLSLINRQKAEVERLQHKNSELEAELDDLKRDDLPRCKDALRRANEIGMDLEKENQELKEENDRWKDVMETVAKCASEARQIAAEHARAEAIKEFADRLKEKKKFHYDYYANLGIRYVAVDTIDNLVKEMVGDDNGA